MSAEGTIAEVLAGTARWCVVEGDNAPILAALGDGAVDHVITDPPYDARTHKGALTGSKEAMIAKEASANTIAFAHLSSPGELSRALLASSRRWVIAFCTAEQIGEYAAGAGIAWVRTGIWDRVNPAPQITGDRPGTAVDAIAIMHRAGRKRWNGGGRAGIWRHSAPTGRERPDHPTPKPVALMCELVADFTDPDDVILDPFCGSGTTGIACLRTGRRFIGVELDPRHAATAAERLTAEVGGNTVRSARAGQVSMFGGKP